MKKTPLYDHHVKLGARIVEFADWQMPIQYPQGIVAEHLCVRRDAGLFDVSHMGRFRITGTNARTFLRQALTNDAGVLTVGSAQYTMLANDAGGAIDDAFCYHAAKDKYLLVVNASNKDKDLSHLHEIAKLFADVNLEDVSEKVAMVALQGPKSEQVLQKLLTGGKMPDPARNSLSNLRLADIEGCAARTGYTGEPVCFELFIMTEQVGTLWDRLIDNGALPIGLGARDTLRLEAGLPLYGHELGIGKDALEIPIFSIPQARFAVDFNDPHRPFVGRKALIKQFRAREAYKNKNYSDNCALPKIVRQFRILDSGIAREGSLVYSNSRPVGWVTSGTMVPYWEYDSTEGCVQLKSSHGQRAIGLCMIEPNIQVEETVEIDVRGRKLKAAIVSKNLENTKGPQTWAVLR